ncbi:MAG: ribonuclease III [SAR202 cluster bacterium]|nr:ribonuclease III [SAR202 cluster bacterium]
MTSTRSISASLKERFGVEFRDDGLLGLALIHASFANEVPGASAESNERLEFLGDALLNLVVAQELFQQHPDWPEGMLTSARAALVRTETLAGVAESLSLGAYLVMGKGEETSGGRGRPSNLAAALEALAGALLLDQGYAAARRFVLAALDVGMREVADAPPPQNAKSMLQELVQSMGMPPPVYDIVEISGRDHAREFTAEVRVDDEVKGRGSGPRKALAEQQAAEQALHILQARA